MVGVEQGSAWERNPLAVILTLLAAAAALVILLRNGLWSARLWWESREIRKSEPKR